MDNSWNGASLVPIVDHINGDPNDDHRENWWLILSQLRQPAADGWARNRGQRSLLLGDNGTPTASPTDDAALLSV